MSPAAFWQGVLKIPPVTPGSNSLQPGEVFPSTPISSGRGWDEAEQPKHPSVPAHGV